MNDKKSDLIRGNIDTIILQSLSEGDKYGYEIAKEIEERCNGKFQLKQPTLYSCLKRLEEQNLVVSYVDSKKSGGGERKYFTLTEFGHNQLAENKNNLEYVRKIIDMLVSDSDEPVSEFDNINNINNGINYSKYSPISKNFLNENNEKEKFLNTREVTDYPDKNIDFSILNTNKQKISQRTSSYDFLDEKPINDYKKIIGSLIQKPTTQISENIEEVNIVSNNIIDVNKEINEIDIQQKKDYDTIKNELLIKGVKLKPFHEDTNYMKFGMLLKYKIALFNCILLTVFVVLDLLLFYIFCDNVAKIGLPSYITIFSLSIIPLLITFIIYARNRNYKERDRVNFKKRICFSFLAFLWIVAITTVICFVSKINFGSQEQVFTYLLLPSLISFNIPLSIISYQMLKLSTFFFAK